MRLKNIFKDLPSDEETPLLFHAKIIGKIAVGVGAVAAVSLLAVLVFVAPSAGDGYGEIISAHMISSQQLGPALLISGLVMVAFAAWLTWMIVLYATFRIAGPLFRFEKNLESVIENGPGPIISIRQGDRLQAENKLLLEGARRLETHYKNLSSLAEKAEMQIATLQAGDSVEARKELVRLVAEIRKEESAIAF